MTLPAMAAGTPMAYSLTGPPLVVSTKNPLTRFPLAAVSTSLPGAASSEPWAGEVEGEGEGEGDADDDVCDGEAVGFSVVVTDEGPGLGAPAGIVTDGVGGLAEGAALRAGDGAALARPGIALDGMALDETPATPAPRPRAEA